ncbi:MAG: DUF6445 family protein [Steroidobacteraceae bacterium]
MRSDLVDPASLAGKCSIHRIGRELRPVLAIDDFMPEPEELVACAASGDSFKGSPHDYYPGVRKPMPAHYAAGFCEKYAKILREVFGLGPTEPLALLSAFSIATTRPTALRPIQRLPHFDTSDAHQLAVVHYLCDARHGGTSFYRHRQTGFETISQQRLQGYAEILKRQVMTEFTPPPAYMNGDNALFERIASFEAQFNRALIYPSNLLHSANILRLHTDHDPRKARLTANTFLKFPAQSA